MKSRIAIIGTVMTVLMFLSAQAGAQSADEWVERGIEHFYAGEYETAIEFFTSAIETDPMHDVAYNGRGASYKALGQYEKAISDFSTSIDLNPEYVKPYYNRGDL